MRPSHRSIHILSVFFIISTFGYFSIASALERVSGAVHLDTNISDGVLSPEEMVKKLKRQT